MNLDYPQNHFDVSDEEKIILEEKSRMADFEDKLLHFLTNSKKTVTQIGEAKYKKTVYRKKESYSRI